MAVSAWQIQLPTGVVVGAGTSVNIVSVTGLRDLAALRGSDQAKGQSDGMYPGLNLLGERAVNIVWDVTLASGGVEAAIQKLSAAYQNIGDPATVCMTAGDWLRQNAGIGATNPVSMLQVQLPNRSVPLYVFGRPGKFNVPIDLNYQYGKVQIVTEWLSPDGVIYDGTVVGGDQAGLPTPSTGLSWPASFPWTFGQSVGGSFGLNNTGSYPASPFMVITGPVSYPVLTNTNTGAFIALDIVLGASDTLTVDHQAGVVKLNGSNRNNVVRVGSSFFTCMPGNTTIQFSSSDSVAAGGLSRGYILPTYSAV